MRSLKVLAFASVAALTLAAAPVQAHPIHPFPHPAPGGHFGHGGWGPGYWGGAGLAFGLAGAALATGAYVDYCVSYVPVYDDWGNYVGRRAVNAC